MNFLELVNLTRSEAGVAGGDLNTLQAGLSLEGQRFKSWVANEWKKIQAEHSDWQFLRSNFEFDTVADQAKYTPQQAKVTDDGTNTGASILASWKLDSLRISTSGNNYADEALAGFLTWEQYRNLYQYGRMRFERSKPVVFTSDPQKNLWFGIIPNGAYTVNGEFYRTPQALSADEDEPLMPERFHSLVAYKALRAYGIFQSAPEVIGRADDVISTLYMDLIADQLPTMQMGAPLA